VDKNGVIQKANLVIATAQNNIAMNRTVRQLATHFIDGKKGNITEGMLNRVEAGIRCYDPCLSCSTHALGQMPFHVQVLDSNGRLVDEVWR
jgi:NAD-reducing hydrogenase large subunit